MEPMEPPLDPPLTRAKLAPFTMQHAGTWLRTRSAIIRGHPVIKRAQLSVAGTHAGIICAIHTQQYNSKRM